MPYTKETDIPAAEGETIVRLADTDDLVAVQCPVARDAQDNKVVFMPSARWIDVLGETQDDAGGRRVATVFTVKLAADDVARLGGADIVRRECQLLVLGESLTPDATTPEVTMIAWSQDIVSQCSIRNAISAARVTAPAAADVL